MLLYALLFQSQSMLKSEQFEEYHEVSDALIKPDVSANVTNSTRTAAYSIDICLLKNLYANVIEVTIVALKIYLRIIKIVSTTHWQPRSNFHTLANVYKLWLTVGGNHKASSKSC